MTIKHYFHTSLQNTLSHSRYWIAVGGVRTDSMVAKCDGHTYGTAEYGGVRVTVGFRLLLRPYARTVLWRQWAQSSSARSHVRIWTEHRGPFNKQETDKPYRTHESDTEAHRHELLTQTALLGRASHDLVNAWNKAPNECRPLPGRHLEI